jgi:DNA topoisomerase VI subunit B
MEKIDSFSKSQYGVGATCQSLTILINMINIPVPYHSTRLEVMLKETVSPDFYIRLQTKMCLDLLGLNK